MATVLALTVAACWPALPVLFAGSGPPASSAGAGPTLPAVSTPSSPAPTTNSGPITLTVLAPSYGTSVDHAFWDGVAADFHAAHPDVTVSVEQVGDRADLAAESSARVVTDPPDLFLGVSIDDFSGNVRGRFYLADQIAPAGGGDLLPCFGYPETSASAPGSGRYGIPFTGSTLELYYNKRLFSQARIAAPPATWSDIAADAAKIKALGKTGYGLALGDPDTTQTAQLWMAGNGGGFMDAAGTTWTVDSAPNIEAFQWIDDNLVKPGRAEPYPGARSVRDLAQDFADGNLGMLVADPGLIAQAEAGAIGNAFAVAPVPGRFKPLTSSVGSVDDLLATDAHPDHKAAIGEFVAFLLSPTYQKRFADLAGRLPVTRSGIAAEGANPLLKPFLEAMPAVDWPPSHNPAWAILHSTMQSLADEGEFTDPKAFLDQLQTYAAGRP